MKISGGKVKGNISSYDFKYFLGLRFLNPMYLGGIVKGYAFHLNSIKKF